MKRDVTEGRGAGLMPTAMWRPQVWVRRRRLTQAVCVAMVCVTFASCSSGAASEPAVATSAVPAPAENLPGPSGSLPDDVDPAAAAELTKLLKGTSVEEATRQLEAAGWVVRAYDVDDPSATLTADFSPGRVTIGSRQGIVLGVEIG